MLKNHITLIISLLFLSVAGYGQQPPFTNINADLYNLGFSYAAWGDWDHDGDLDFALTGEPGSTIPVTKIYRNDSGSFADIQANIPGFTYSSVEWGDYDNDSDLDLLITGNDSLGIPATKIFRNDNGTFIDILADLPAISQGYAAWGDSDNDNNLDILLAGNLQGIPTRILPGIFMTWMQEIIIGVFKPLTTDFLVQVLQHLRYLRYFQSG